MHFLSLTSDFGHESHYIGLCKLIIRQQLPNVQIIDITHDIKPFNSFETCYFFQASASSFPLQSAHFILTDLYGSKSEQLIYANDGKHHVFGVDNGIVPELFNERPFKLYKLKKGASVFTPTEICLRFAECYASLLDGNYDELQEITADQIKQSLELKNIYYENHMMVQVIYIDRFENIILNLTKATFEEHRKGRSFKIEFLKGDIISSLSQSYKDVQEFQKVAFFNASGFLEIGVNRSNAAGLFGFRNNNSNLNFYKTMKIIFE